MTSQEAREQIEECERQITDAYHELRTSVRYVGKIGYQAAADEKTGTINRGNIIAIMEYLFPLVLFFICIEMLLVDHFPIILLLFCGGYIGFLFEYGSFGKRMVKHAEKELDQIRSKQKIMNDILDSNQEI